MSTMRKLSIVLTALAACTDAELAQMSALGNEGHIRCFSGGKLIYEADSTGKIATEDKSDGWYLKDKRTGLLVRVSGDCVIESKP